jgi:hypothetical protein
MTFTAFTPSPVDIVLRIGLPGRPLLIGRAGRESGYRRVITLAVIRAAASEAR